MKAFLRVCGLLSLFCALTVPSRAIGLLIVDEPGSETNLVLRVPARPIHRFMPLEVKSAKVATKINDQIARTKIEEEFYNPNATWLEGTFYLPLPKGAHLEKFALEVNGKMTDAELLPADKAKGIYQEIVRKAQDPALLEYLGRDLVKVRIFPIEPHSTKRIEVAYTQVLKSDAGLVSYTLPLSTAKYCAAPVKNLNIKVELESATALKTIYSPTHKPEIKRKGDKSALVGLEESESRSEKDFQLLFSAEKSELGLSFLTYRKEGEDGYFMLLATPGLAGQKPLPKDVVFVMDTSGSMAGAKIDQARKALQFCVSNLNREDRFELIRFSTEAEALFEKLADVTDEARKQAEEFARNLKATGGTAINDALAAALKLRPEKSARPFFVVFVTDGLPTIGITSEEKILENVKRASGGVTRIFCFGVGTDVNTHLLDKMAEETRAVSQYVLPDEDLELKVSSFFSKISDPVLADVEIDFGSVRTSKLHPGKLPDLFKGQQVVAFGRYASSGKTKARISGKVGGEEKVFTYDLHFAERSTGHEFIPRLWASRRVGHLLDQIRLHGESAEIKEEVTTLAKQYSIVTPYTSFLVTEDRPGQTPPLEEQLVFQRGDRGETSGRQGQAVPTQSRVRSLRAAKSGELAVADSRYAANLKDALSETEALNAPSEVQRYLQTGRLVARKEISPEAPTQRFVGRRTFLFDGTGWTEAAAAQLPDAVAVRLEFNSKEYWEFAAKHPELNDVLALGTNVKFVFEGKLYEIFSNKK